MTNPHFTMPKVRVLVADGSKARWFQVDTPNGELDEISTLTHPQARQHEQDLTTEQKDLNTDRAGRRSDYGQGQRSALNEASRSPKESELNRFASDITKMLESERTQGNLERLYLVAPPSFLGVLRKHMDDDLKRLVAEEVQKDLVVRKPTEIREYLPTYLK